MPIFEFISILIPSIYFHNIIVKYIIEVEITRKNI